VRHAHRRCRTIRLALALLLLRRRTAVALITASASRRFPRSSCRAHNRCVAFRILGGGDHVKTDVQGSDAK
jgi:hypothetical protein